MTRARIFPTRPLRLLAVAAALCAAAAYASDYDDVNQLLRSGKPAEALARADHSLAANPRDAQMRFNDPMMLHHHHLRVLLADAGTTGDLDAQAFALHSLLDADYVQFQLTERGQTLEMLGDAWESVARKLCGQ